MVELRERIQRIGLLVKSALFTIVIHGILLSMLLVGQWPFSQESIKRGTTKPIQAQVISTDYIQQKKVAKLAQEKKTREQEEKRLETEKKRKQEAEKKRLEAEKKKKREQEKKRLEAEKKRKQEAEKKRLEAEKKKKREQEKKRLEAEKKRKQEAEKKRLEAEKKKKREQEKKRLEAERLKREQEAEKKRLEAEKKKKREQEKKRLEAERLKREQELKEKLEKERILQQLAQTKLDAATALSALVDRIAITVENNWRRPLNSGTGLEVTINVKVSRNGDVLSANVVKSSGDRFFDQSAERAVKKASPLPFPLNPKYYEFIDVFNIKFNPDDE